MKRLCDSWVERIPRTTRKLIISITLAIGFAAITIPFLSYYHDEVSAAQKWSAYQKKQTELSEKLEIAKYGDRIQRGVMSCLDQSSDDSCLPELKKLQDLIKKIPGEDSGELDWWYMAILWQSSNGAVNGANNDRLVKRAHLYKYVDQIEPYLYQNDPTREKFHQALRQKMLSIDRDRKK